MDLSDQEIGLMEVLTYTQYQAAQYGFIGTVINYLYWMFLKISGYLSTHAP